MYFVNWLEICLIYLLICFRLEIIEQVNEAPRVYILAVAEVVRRRSFSSQFQKVSYQLGGCSSNPRPHQHLRT